MFRQVSSKYNAKQMQNLTHTWAIFHLTDKIAKKMYKVAEILSG